jgi:transposase
MLRHRLRDATWASLYARLVTLPGIWKKDPKPLRRFVEAVVYVLHTGIAWADLPATFGEAGTAYRRFRRWACKGFWDELFVGGIPTDTLETVMVDSTTCKAQRFASGARGGGEEALGRSRGGLSTKVHALVDALGRPLCFLLTPGQAADCRQARPLLEGVTFERLIGDRAYDTNERAMRKFGVRGQAAACSSAACTGSPSRKRTPWITWASRSEPSSRRQLRSADLASL